MTTPAGWVAPDEWAGVVESGPLVSVDLIVRCDDGILLGLRENEPAKGEWFVPGGVVFKNERLPEAVQRVADTEFGCEVRLERYLGVFEHFYDTADVEGVEDKHYVAHAYVVHPGTEDFASDDQHADLRVFRPPFEGLHPYVERYLDRMHFGVNATAPRSRRLTSTRD